MTPLHVREGRRITQIRLAQGLDHPIGEVGDDALHCTLVDEQAHEGGQAGRAVREEFLAPANYAHTGTLARSQTISFTISPRAGELSAVFEPVYSQKVQP